MPKGPMMPFGGGKPRPPEPERVIEPAHAPTPPRQYQAPQRLAEPATPAVKTVLGPGCSVEGKLICVGPAQIDGKVSGELLADDFLIVDRNAVILADLNVQEVVVRGAVKGNISATRRVTLEETAQVEGDVSAPAIEMRIGAQMSGKIDVIHRTREPQSLASAPNGQALSPPAYQPAQYQPAAAYRQQTPTAQPVGAQPLKESSHTFVAFDDGTERSGF